MVADLAELAQPRDRWEQHCLVWCKHTRMQQRLDQLHNPFWHYPAAEGCLLPTDMAMWQLTIEKLLVSAGRAVGRGVPRVINRVKAQLT